jgi:signal peptide peptidase SppA
MLSTIAGVLARHLAGHAIPDDVKAALTQRERLPQPGEKPGAIAVLPVHGVLIPRGNLLSEMSGATSLDVLTGQLREAMATDAVKTIVLDVNSPGGSVAGASEFAREVMKARTKKPIVAVAQYTMASCAYWIAAAATEIVASESALVVSIGVYTIHTDLSKALAELGIKRTYISAGKYKVSGNETEPLNPEDEARIKRRLVDPAYARMLSDISKGRGVPLEEIRNGYGEGDTLPADEALTLGMIDKIATLEETIARVAAVAPSRDRRAATDATPLITGTAQELLPDVPVAATAQDRISDAAFRARMKTALLHLQV